MRCFTTLSLLHLFASIRTQQNGDATPEKAPPLIVQECTRAGCTDIKGVATIDANWRWAYQNDSSKTNCYKGNTWATGPCPTGADCAKNCYLDGANYKDSYGVEATTDGLKLSFVTKGPYGDINYGSRLYFLVGEEYKLFTLKNKEFSFTVDVSNLPCGLNGALYFAGMKADGGKSEQPGNKCGASKGLGYCDAQCPQDIKWIGGKANSEGWVPSPTDPNSGTGNMGSCCCEMDIWEANSISQAYTPHVCTKNEPTICTKDECANKNGTRYDGICDKDGCDFASYRWGAKDFYGANKKVDTTKKFTVVTQFLTSDGTDKGQLSEIKRLYIQDNKVIKNEAVKIGSKSFDSITQDFCDATKVATKDVNDFAKKGGMKGMDACLDKGMVLVLSLWDDQMAHMDWLDGNYPHDKPITATGVSRGTCNATAGEPEFVRKNSPSASVEFSQIKIGAIGFTTSSAPKSANDNGNGRVMTTTSLDSTVSSTGGQR